MVMHLRLDERVKILGFLARSQGLNSVVRDMKPLVYLLEQMDYTVQINGYRRN